MYFKTRVNTENGDEGTIVHRKGEEISPSYKELNETVNQLQRNKATKNNEISNELVKYGEEMLFQKIHNLMN